MEKVIKKLFEDSKFSIIIGKSLIITITFFIMIDDLIQLLKKGLGIFTLMAISFLLIFWVFILNEIKNE